MKLTQTKTLVLRASVLLIGSGLSFAGCGGDSNSPSPEVKVSQDQLGLPGGSFPKGNDPALVDYKSVPDGKYEFAQAKADITHSDTGATYMVGFEIDQLANKVTNAVCTPDAKAKENAFKIRGASMSFGSPLSFSVASGIYKTQRDQDFWIEAEMKSTNDACALSVYPSSGSSSALQVLAIFSSKDAAKDGAVYTQKIADGSIKAAFRKGKEGGLELIYLASSSGLSVAGVIYFKLVP